MLTRTTAGLAVAATALVAAGAVAAGPGAGTTKVKVVLKEWKLVPSKTVVPAGRVTFQVQNMGQLPHEMVVLRSEAHHHALHRGRAEVGGRHRVAQGAAARG